MNDILGLCEVMLYHVIIKTVAFRGVSLHNRIKSSDYFT